MTTHLRPTVLMVCTREIPEQSENGRERTMAFIRRSLAAQGDVQFFRLRSVLEQASIRRFFSIVAALILGIVRGRPLPLQALLFHDPRQAREIEISVANEKPETVYFDGVRSGVLSISLRKRFPNLRIVCDFDDLMSLRMQVLYTVRAPISMGYLSKSAPRWVQTYLLDGLVGRMLQKYEKFALASMEKSIATACNSVVLVSSVDAKKLLEMAPVKVNVIPPFMQSPRIFNGKQTVKRFVFIGSDSLLQNRLSIEFLIKLWQHTSPQKELHIYGKQSRPYSQVPNVIFHGFVRDLADAYEPGSVLLAPAFLSGGVKTKVLEAMAHGVIPLGTQITFEGIDAPFEGLVYSENEWETIVRDPVHFSSTWNEAARRAIAAATQSHSADYLSGCWRQVIWPS